jgi:hypothetical protein
MISNGDVGGEMTNLLACFMRQSQHDDELEDSHHQSQYDDFHGSHLFLQGNPEFTIRKDQSSIYF